MQEKQHRPLLYEFFLLKKKHFSLYCSLLMSLTAWRYSRVRVGRGGRSRSRVVVVVPPKPPPPMEPAAKLGLANAINTRAANRVMANPHTSLAVVVWWVATAFSRRVWFAMTASFVRGMVTGASYRAPRGLQEPRDIEVITIP